MNIKRTVAFLLMTSTLLSFCACGRKEPEETKTAVTAETHETITVETETEEELPLYRNPLTGLGTETDLSANRPTAIIMNNIHVALPQRSLNQMDIVYECLAEGGITRLLGVVQDVSKLGEIGSMRSARPYFVEMALSHDAVFVHAGGSERAYMAIERLKVNDVDGVKRGPFSVNGTNVFWRDQNRINQGASIEHTMFTSGANITAAIQAKGYRTLKNDPAQTAFKFRLRAKAIENAAGDATYIMIPHSTYVTSELNYNAEDNKYYHTQFGEKHIDELDGQQLATDNAFILFTAQELYPGQTNTSYRKIDVVGEGNGYYFYGGKYVPIVWKRADETAPFKYYGQDGNELEVNPGKSFISIVDKATANSVVISAQQ